MNPIFHSAEKYKDLLDQHRPLDPAIVANLREDLIVRWTYHSNAIGGKSLREHLEAVNHRDAILLLEEFVQKNEPLDEWTIKSLHHLILRGINDDNAGRYRTVNVRISGAEHLPPDQLVVPELMERFVAWYRDEAMALWKIASRPIGTP